MATTTTKLQYATVRALTECNELVDRWFLFWCCCCLLLLFLKLQFVLLVSFQRFYLICLLLTNWTNKKNLLRECLYKYLSIFMAALTIFYRFTWFPDSQSGYIISFRFKIGWVFHTNSIILIFNTQILLIGISASIKPHFGMW